METQLLITFVERTSNTNRKRKQLIKIYAQYPIVALPLLSQFIET